MVAVGFAFSGNIVHEKNSSRPPLIHEQIRDKGNGNGEACEDTPHFIPQHVFKAKFDIKMQRGDTALGDTPTNTN